VNPIDDALREELSALLDGALEEPRASELRARLAREPELSAEYEALEAVVRAVRALPPERAPAELRAAVRERLPRSRIVPMGLVAVAALAAALLVAVLLRPGEEAPVGGRELASGGAGRGAGTDAPKDADRPRTGVGPNSAVPPDLRAPVGTGRVADDVAEESEHSVGLEGKAAEQQASLRVEEVRDRLDTPEARKAYFARLRALSGEEVRAHLGRFDPPAAKAEVSARMRGAAPSPLEAVVPGVDEAQEIRQILLIAFPPPSKEEVVRRDVETTSVELAPEGWGRLDLHVAAATDWAPHIGAWLQTVSVAAPPAPPKPDAGPAAGGGTPAEAAKAKEPGVRLGSAKRTVPPLEIRILFPAPPPPPSTDPSGGR